MNSKLNNRSVNSSVSTAPEVTLINANVVLQKALQGFSLELKNNIILRCDELPVLSSSEVLLERALTELLRLIINNRPRDTKLFLHIRCSENERKEEGSKATGSDRYYLLQFHSNTSPYAEWLHHNQQQINHIAALLTPIGGSLMVNHLKNSGSIFCLSLPGK